MPSPKRFENPWHHAPHRVASILAWKLGLRHVEAPELADAPDHPAGWRAVGADAIARPPASGWRVLWLGHASFLIQGAGLSLLVDPVFASHCSPVPLPGLRRRVPPPCSLGDLPPIDAVLLSHSHYDHLDLATLRRLGRDTRLLVPEGHASWLRRKGFAEVTELAWGESANLPGGTTVTATPAQHFTARSPRDFNRGHWCGWHLAAAGVSLWHAGDSGFCPAFRTIGERHGPIDFGMIPIGAYQPRAIMRPMHMDPDEAVAAFLEARCRQAVAMHWGTFRLTDEPLSEPRLRLERATASAGLPGDAFTAWAVGESRTILPTTLT